VTTLPVGPTDAGEPAVTVRSRRAQLPGTSLNVQRPGRRWCPGPLPRWRRRAQNVAAEGVKEIDPPEAATWCPARGIGVRGLDRASVVANRVLLAGPALDRRSVVEPGRADRKRATLSAASESAGAESAIAPRERPRGDGWRPSRPRGRPILAAPPSRSRCRRPPRFPRARTRARRRSNPRGADFPPPRGRHR